MITLHQLELDQSLVNCGMSYVFHLRDGGFFLIDGGYFTPGDEDSLYAFLRGLAKGVPHIAGWFFSHAHQDHIGNFISFLTRYHDRFTLGSLLYNFQPMDFSALAPEADWRGSDLATIRAFYEAVRQYAPAVPIRTLHTGDRLAFGDLALEALYTHEDLDTTNAKFNDHSTVIRATVSGQSILFLGDVGEEGSRILLRNPDRLRGDIVQVSHHGFPGATRALYEAIGAKIALWPTPAYELERLVADETIPVNRYLWSAAAIAEHIVSGHGDAALALPYTEGTATRQDTRFAHVTGYRTQFDAAQRLL